MAPTPSRQVGSPYVTLKPPARADAWSLYYPDQTSTSSLPMRDTPRSDGHPARDDSLPRPPPAQATHRQANWPTLDPSPGRSRPTWQQRIDDFAVSLPLSAGDKALDYSINATRKLGRAASKRLHSFQQDSNASPSPVIGQPTLIEWDNLDQNNLVDRESIIAEHQARSQAWQQQNQIRSHEVEKSPRRVVASTWGAVLYAAYEQSTPPEMPTLPSEQPLYQDAADMTRTRRKPIRKPLNTDKPLPPVPRPDSWRRKTVIPRPETALSQYSDGSLTSLSDTIVQAQRSAAPSPSSSCINHQSHPFDFRITQSNPDQDFDTLSHQTSHPKLNNRNFHTDSADEPRTPIVDQFIRAGHISTYAHQVRDGERFDSWHIQHARAYSAGDTVVGSEREEDEEYEDGATNLWKRLEATAGVRMRD
ncbi:hypothetical protein Slin15195_G023540 [Septoria linicola]|uniref:Uncharacterized protein n=1 Tax=Septoria linicola TaxID=215465 RepID=A0A9Q9EFJ9_9PEZI|nr:hypothetical protein Slin14017_G022620 [Septoria linicola]USW49035.1 hypothetical protein Slin15195_G023540 [Septoria linicola]